MSTCNEVPKYDLVTKVFKKTLDSRPEEEKSLDFAKGRIKIINGNIDHDDAY